MPELPMLRKILFAVLAATALNAHAGDFTLQVQALDADGRLAASHVYDGFGCTGGNLAPALHWNGAPAGARSFAITVYDPAAPTGSGWWHWFVVNIPASSHGLPAGGALPAGAAEVHNDFGTLAYGGPCPPKGDQPHPYQFTVYALDVAHLDVPANATAALAGFLIHGHVIGKAQQVVRYGR
jgi:Raf kinase inhibitor-like YbhB/YbcL family protein